MINRRTFQVTTQAASLHLLTLAELREAAGVAVGNTARDAELQRVGLAVAERISRYCRVKGDGVIVPTLLSEVCVETIRDPSQTEEILLCRRFITAASVVLDDVAVDSADYIVSKVGGSLFKLQNDRPALWSGSKVVVTYTAGFATPPPALVDAARRMVRLSLSGESRDPMLKAIDIPDVARREYWVNDSESSGIPQDVQDLLGPFESMVFA